ncbi:hypothetical protein GC173_05580 [bacterium]|nr:hypothetical protein [bacterium]
MGPFALAGLSILQFAIMARVVFFDSWDEFKLAFALFRHPIRVLKEPRESVRARFATSKLFMLAGFTAVLTLLTWMVASHFPSLTS